MRKGLGCLIVSLGFVVPVLGQSPRTKPPSVTTPSTILSGYCIPATPNNDTTSAYLAGLGNSISSPLCWAGNSPYDNGLPMPSNGTLKNLTVAGLYTDGGGSPATWPVNVQVLINFVPSKLACTVSLSGGTANPIPVKCADQTDRVVVNAGDILTVEMSTPNLMCDNDSCPGIGLNVALEKTVSPH